MKKKQEEEEGKRRRKKEKEKREGKRGVLVDKFERKEKKIKQKK